MAEKTTTVKSSGLLSTYIVAIVTLLIAAVCGAITIGISIALLTNHSVALPGFVGMLLDSTDKLVAPVALGLTGALAGLAGFIALAKIKKSAEAGQLVASKEFQTTNTVVIIASGLVGAAFVIYALSVSLATLLAIQDGLPWGSYYLGQFVPALLVGGALIGVSLLIKMFSKAKVSAIALSVIFWVVALVGFVFVSVVIGIKSHDQTAASVFGGSNYTTTNNVTNTEPGSSVKPATINRSSGSCSDYKTTSEVVNAYLDKDLTYSEYLDCYSQLSGYSR